MTGTRLHLFLRQCFFFLMLLSTSNATKHGARQGSGPFPPSEPLPTSRFRAVTVLHKPCSSLGYTLTNFASNLGPEWPILVLHNEDVTPHLNKNKIVRLQKKNRILRTAALEKNGFPALTTIKSYSKLLASTRFWTLLRAEHVLLFQMDSVLCSMSPWKVDDFLQYDYIGAPWIDKWYGMDIGNGGLSLRKTKTMIRITRTFKFNVTENEDIYFSRGIYKLARRDPSIEIPPVHVAAKFAYEAGRLPRVVSFGVHKTPLMRVDKGTIAKTCPEAMATVWNGCQVDTYDETTRGAMFQIMDRRFLAVVDQRLDVLDFEKDFTIKKKKQVGVPPRKITHMSRGTEKRFFQGPRVHVVVLRLVLLLLLLLILFLVRVPREGLRRCVSSSVRLDQKLAILKTLSWRPRFVTAKEVQLKRSATASISRQRIEAFSRQRLLDLS